MCENFAVRRSDGGSYVRFRIFSTNSISAVSAGGWQAQRHRRSICGGFSSRRHRTEEHLVGPSFRVSGITFSSGNTSLASRHFRSASHGPSLRRKDVLDALQSNDLSVSSWPASITMCSFRFGTLAQHEFFCLDRSSGRFCEFRCSAHRFFGDTFLLGFRAVVHAGAGCDRSHWQMSSAFSQWTLKTGWNSSTAHGDRPFRGRSSRRFSDGRLSDHRVSGFIRSRTFSFVFVTARLSDGGWHSQRCRCSTRGLTC